MVKQAELEQMIELALEWIREAGQKLIVSLKEELSVEFKSSAADLVTEKDREIEHFLGAKILARFPEHAILGEEGINKSEDLAQKEWLWIIDPIDGTTNFVHQQKNFTISVAVAHQGTVLLGFIYDPVQQVMYHARRGHGAYKNNQLLPRLKDSPIPHSVVGINALWLTPNRYKDFSTMQRLVKALRGTRSYGSAALELAYVADNTLDGYISFRLSPWDYSAGWLMVEEVGGLMTTLEGEKLPLFTERSSIFAANGQLHQEISTLLGECETK